MVDEEPWDGPGVHPGRVVATLGRVLPADAIVTTDAGDFGTWAARGYRFRRPGTFLGSTSGAMGFGLPAAIGATLARPGRLGVALAGDGGFAMTMAELETAVRERAHVIAIVFDNRRYGTIWRHQALRGGPSGLAARLGAVDFAAIAEACGVAGPVRQFRRGVRAGVAAGHGSRTARSSAPRHGSALDHAGRHCVIRRGPARRWRPNLRRRSRSPSKTWPKSWSKRMSKPRLRRRSRRRIEDRRLRRRLRRRSRSRLRRRSRRR